LWNIVTRRPAAVWRAHKGSILAIDVWKQLVLTFVWFFADWRR
jgi:hypothetical protein